MQRSRKVVLTIEVNTSLTVKELKQLKGLVFGTLKGKGRRSIKAEPPHQACRIKHSDCRGSIEQVQVNAVR